MVEDERPKVETSVTRDTFFGGRLVLHQPAKGHRSGTDAVLLAASVPRDFRGRVYDIGAGVGAVGLGIAMACPGAEVTLVENDPVCVALAGENIVANEFSARTTVARCNLLSHDERRAVLPEPADLVVTNPPFYHAAGVRASPDAGRRAAHVFDAEIGLDDWLLACLSLLGPKGMLIVIHQAEALPDILRILAGKLGGLIVKSVHPRAGEPAVRVLVCGRRGSRAPFKITVPLVLHEGHVFTDEAGRLHAGGSQLKW